MYYLIPTDSTEPLPTILESASRYESSFNAKREAEARKEETGRNWDVVEVKFVWTTQTLAVPHMARD